MRYYNLIILLLIFSGSASAGELIKDTEIVMIGNTANGQDDFFIQTQGGTGPCAGTPIVFPASAAPSKEYHARAYSLALAAFSMGNTKVRVYNFTNDFCSAASYIEMAK